MGSFQLEKLPYRYDALAPGIPFDLNALFQALPNLTILIMPLPELNMKINPSKTFYQS
jgi:hypothetical protein